LDQSDESLKPLMGAYLRIRILPDSIGPLALYNHDYTLRNCWKRGFPAAWVLTTIMDRMMRNLYTHPLMVNPEVNLEFDENQTLGIGDVGIGPDQQSLLEECPVLASDAIVALECLGITNLGLVREDNEDRFFLSTWIHPHPDQEPSQTQAQGLFILCDGMGGHQQGEVASTLATATLADVLQAQFQRNFPSEFDLKSAIFKANHALHSENLRHHQSGYGRMGTTAVVTVLQDRSFRIGTVGDSRCYALTQTHGLQQLTTDHEVGQRAIARGIDPAVAYAHPHAYHLTQALGPRPNPLLAPEVTSHQITEDTVLLLCSDGLSDNQLLETHGEEVLQSLLDPSQSLATGASALMTLALDRNGHDNITVILVRVRV
jgi:protein phosphatase